MFYIVFDFVQTIHLKFQSLPFHVVMQKTRFQFHTSLRALYTFFPLGVFAESARVKHVFLSLKDMQHCHPVAFLSLLLMWLSTRGTSDSHQWNPVRVTHGSKGKHVSVPSLPDFTMARGHDYTCLKLGIHSGSI